jgi:hypothetical protein
LRRLGAGLGLNLNGCQVCEISWHGLQAHQWFERTGQAPERRANPFGILF